MTYSLSLRAIGQSLEILKLVAFDLDKDGDDYVLNSDSLTKTGEWILRNTLSVAEIIGGDGDPPASSRTLRFSPPDILRLNTVGQKRRRDTASLEMPKPTKLSQLLRTLGDHLDRTRTNEFHISWKPDAVLVDYRLAGGAMDRRTFTPEKLQQLGSLSRFRRSRRSSG